MILNGLKTASMCLRGYWSTSLQFMAQQTFKYSHEHLKDMRRLVFPLAPEVKAALLQNSILKLRSRPRGKRAGRKTGRFIKTVVGHRPGHCGTISYGAQGGGRQYPFVRSSCSANLVHIHIAPIKPKPTMPGFLLSNVRSLRHKSDELYSIASNNNTAVVAVSETWLNDAISDSTVAFPGYTLHRKDRTGSRGGGVALYTFDGIPQKRLTHLEDEQHEALWIWLRPHRLPRGLSCIVACVLYIPPRSSATAKSETQVTQYLDSCLRDIECNYQKAAVVILGDTNRYNYESICVRHGLRQVVSGATRKASQHDSIFTNISAMYASPVHLPPVSTSDHQTILWKAGEWPKKPTRTITCRKRTPDTMRHLGLLMNSTDFFHIHDLTDPEVKVTVFTDTIQSILNQAVPFKRVSLTNQDMPWMTVQVKNLLKDRQHAYCTGDESTYRRLRTIVDKKIKSAKYHYYKNEVEDLRYSNSRQWFKSIKALMGMEDSQKVATNDPHIQQFECDTLAKHFASVWGQSGHTLPSEEEVSHKLSPNVMPSLSIGQVKARLRSINPSKAAGPDSVPSWLLKSFCEELAPVLCDVFYSCMRHNIFPALWKKALVKAIPKKTRPSFPSDYRQISLVSCVGKIYEGILRDVLLQDTASQIAPTQHGFMSSRSTVTALIHILQQWHEALNNSPKLDVHAVFVDFSRAFDTINHSQLLKILAKMQIRRPLWLSLKSYLSDREQTVQWGSCTSPPFAIPAGVPQGGLLSPLLFVICINSLDACLPSSILPVKYADDLTLSELLMGTLPGLMQKALDSVDEWGQEFSLAVNGSKTMDMVLSARRECNIPCPSLPEVSGHVIQRVSTFKLLGVKISSDLSWDAHIKYMLSRVNPRIHYLNVAQRAGLPPDVLKQVYLSFIRPVLEYASPVWGGLTKGLSDELERVQKRCCRIIGIPPSSLSSLSERRDKATVHTLHNILKDSSSPLQTFITQAPSSGYELRHQRQFLSNKSRTKRHEMSFIPRALRLIYS